MNTEPDCIGFLGKIFGHKYIPIFNETRSSSLPDQFQFESGTVGAIEACKKRQYTKTYIKTLCKRCGKELK
jgi:hypothetical protein